jgi:hypothetical protein
VTNFFVLLIARFKNNTFLWSFVLKAFCLITLDPFVRVAGVVPPAFDEILIRSHVA